MANNKYNDKEGQYPIKTVTLETVDGAVYDYFDKKLKMKVDSAEGRRDVKTMFAVGERWALTKKNGFRDDNGTLILPIISIKRGDIARNTKFGGMTSAQKSITVSKFVHQKSSIVKGLMDERRNKQFFRNQKEPPPIYETLTIPTPDFSEIQYKITIWTQYSTQMNEILEKMFYNYVNAGQVDSFVMPVEYDEDMSPTEGYYFVAFPYGIVTKQSNDDDLTDSERAIKYTFDMRVPAYLMLDPDSEALSYGEDEEGKKILYKKQSSNQLKLKESVMSFEEFEKLFG